MKLQEIRRDLNFTLGVLMQQPFDVQIQVTNRCNMKCSFCDFWPNGAKPQEELCIVEFKRLSAELSKLGTFIVSLEGGEPFVRPDLVEIVRAFSDRHLVFLYTNGWYVDKKIAQALFDAGLTQIGVSIDYPDAQRHDTKRVLPGCFEKAWQAIDAFRTIAPHGGRQVHVITVLMKDNQYDIEELLKLSASHGVGHYITLLSTHGYRRGRGQDFLPDQPVSEKLLELRRRYSNFLVFQDYLNKIDTFINGGQMPTCQAGKQTFNIDHLGYVSACIEKIDKPVGNIRTESLESIYTKLQNLDYVTKCRDCWSLCRGTGQILGNGGTFKGWWDMAIRMRSY
ncbi:MAG: radical SAM protein [Acidobacteriota bacterium]